ncbi:AMP-dependent synthetase [Planctomycetaceae bacterium SCGC AG-212-F19]|nr:AMP-dependent synthetase [Planctomycetaceae bacterium SCGC AG-212-F19]
MRLEQTLLRTAEQWPDKVAVIDGDHRMTYGQLVGAMHQLARLLEMRQVRRGDRVVILLDNSAYAAAAIFGVLAAGAVFSTVHPSIKPGKLAFLLNSLRASAIITSKRFLCVVEEAFQKAESAHTVLVADLPECDQTPAYLAWREALVGIPASAPAHGGIALDLAYVMYTSGSTGIPKGVMMTHQSGVSGGESMNQYLGNTPTDVILSAIPLSFDYGLYQLFMTVLCGGTLVLEQSFTFPNVVLRTLANEKATGLPLVPTSIALLLQMKGLVPGKYPHLRFITTTAAPLPPAHSRRLQELFPTTRIFSNYGMTENIRGTFLPPEQLAIRPTSVGKAMPNSEAYIVDEQGHRLGAGEVGELVIRGPNLMRGYWENPEATAEVLRDGSFPWEKVLYTGDQFYADDEGYLYYVGRKDDIIKSRGEKVSPKEVEHVLCELQGVSEAVVVGIPDAIQGMSIKAVVVPRSDACLTEQQVRNHCARHLEDYMVPRWVEFRSELPTTESGKVRRRDLQIPVG